MSFLEYLVAIRVHDIVDVLFPSVGHTHEDVAQ